MRTNRLHAVPVMFILGCMSGDPTGSHPLASDDTLERRYAEALCATMDRCVQPFFGIKNLRGFGYTPAQCAASAVPGFSGVLRDHAAAVRAGTLRVDAATLDRCLTRVATSCQDESETDLLGTFEVPFIRLCRRAFAGLVAVGGSCRLDAECAGDAVCLAAAGSTCGGVCIARPPPPDPSLPRSCTYDTECPSPASEDDWSICDGRRCVGVRRGPQVGVGERCGRLPSTTTQQTLAPCGAGLFCDQSRVCRRAVRLGEPCERLDICDGRALCGPSPADGPTARRCAVFQLRASVGDPCSLSPYECALHLGLRCRDGRCALATDGAACDGVAATCASGFYCSRGERLCRPMKRAGADCASSAECLSYTCTAGRCDERACRSR